MILGPFVRIIQVNSAGKVIRKKRTQTMTSARDPLFNDTLNFELVPHLIEHMSFVIMIISKPSKVESASERVRF